MKHLTQDGPFCLLYSAAMVLDVDIEYLVAQIGHKEDIHIQEVQTVAHRMGYILGVIELIPQDTHGPLFIVCGDAPMVRMESMIRGRVAILIGKSERGNEHAVAYDGNIVVDPQGRTYDIHEFRLKEAWILIRMTG